MDKNKIKDVLTKEISEENIFIDEPMKKHTSFKIGGVADIFIKVKSVQELQYIIEVAKKENILVTIIGNGSNLLVKDNGIRGIVIMLNMDKIEIEDTIVTVEAGVKLGFLAQKLLKEELTGFEFAAGIPGSIGGAVRMNAGAYGGEMKDIIVETKCLTPSGEIVTLSNEEQEFSYRHSIFMENRYIVLETKIKLQKGNKDEIKAKMDDYAQQRKEKQPISLPSAGSTFKRGTDFVTAKVIDECGLKGFSIGDAQVSTKHAGFVVNNGNATAEDVLRLIEHVQKVVLEKTGKKIELEIEVLGD